MSSPGLTIAVDVDDVCAALLEEWVVVRYNQRSGDSIQIGDITEWDLTKVVREDWRDKVYGILNEPDLYSCIEPFPEALPAVERLRRSGHRVIFVSSCPRNSYDVKAEWLVRHGFLPNTKYLKDFIAASDKSIIMADVLVDDGAHNLETFPKWRVLVTRPHNIKANLSVPHWRVDGMGTAAQMIDAYLKHDFGYWEVPASYRGN